jgi:hypothetical protein
MQNNGLKPLSKIELGKQLYREIVRLQATIDDFPRVRKHLSDKFEAAERALAEFERELK